MRLTLIVVSARVRSKRLLATQRIAWFVGQLARMPDGDDPDGVTDHSMEKPVWRDGQLTMWEFRELGDFVTRAGVLAELRDNSLSASLDGRRSSGALGANEAQGLEILLIRLRRETHSHATSLPREIHALQP